MVPKLKGKLMEAQEKSIINEGDHFRIGPYYFVCMGWENGRILAKGFYVYEHSSNWFKFSLLPELMLDSGFKIIYRAIETSITG